MAGGAPDEPGAPGPGGGDQEVRVRVRRRLRRAASSQLGSQGLGRRRRALCSALPPLAGSRAEGGPSYPDVRSPGLSGGGGGGEAARAAITRETAPSCHQPPVLLSRGVLERSKGTAPSGGAGEPQAGAAGAVPGWAPQTHPQRPRSRASQRPARTDTHARRGRVHTGTPTWPQKRSESWCRQCAGVDFT